MILAQQALTTNALIGGRLILGVGPSHRPAVERAWGLSFEKPIGRMREYLSILLPLLSGETVEFEGTYYTAQGELRIQDGTGVSVLIAALGPQMLRLAGHLTDGTITTMAGPRTLVSHICPIIREAADRAGRPPPRVVSTLSLCVTNDVESARARAEQGARRMAAMPSYATLLEREGGPPLLAGSENELDEAVAGLERAGVTDLLAVSIARRDTEDDTRTAAWISRQARS
jgi:F420-dependent oxidoreductase-like protein